MMMLSVRLVLHCLMLIIICQHVEVEDQLHSSDSPLPVEDSILTEASKSQIDLNRQKRNVNQQAAYINIELSIPENEFSLDTLNMIVDNLTYPFSVNIEKGSSVSVTRITPTTACQLVNNETQCTCISEFTWNSTFCRTYGSCNINPTADPADQTCTCIRAYPAERQFCGLTPKSTSKTTTATSAILSPVRRENKRFMLVIENLNFSNELKNSSSAEYKSRSVEFTSLLNKAYRKVDQIASVEVLGFASGSTIVVHEVSSSSPLTEEAVRNVVDETFSEENYTTKFLQGDKIPCTDSEFGTTNFNSTSEIPCVGMEGVRRRRCGKNGTYDDEHDFCLIPAIHNLLKVTKSSAEVTKNFSSLLHELSEVSQGENITKPGNIGAVVTILTTFSEVNNTVNETDLKNFLKTVSSVISNESIEAWGILSSTTDETNKSSTLLLSVETFSGRLNITNNTLDIRKENLQLRATKVESHESKSPFNVTFDNFSTEGYTNLSTNIFISTDELEKLAHNVVVTIAYPTWIDILPNNTNFKGNFLINGLVVTITLNGKKPIRTKMNFSRRNPALDFKSAQCAFWDFSGHGTWNNAACTPDFDGENVICICKHLTSFSILMSAKRVKDSILNSITQIGVAVSLASLIIAIIIEAVVWRHVTKSKASHIRHVAMLNIAVNLLIADVWFIVAAFVKEDTAACVAATFFIHVFYLALFFWMFTLGLLLLYHLVFLLHDFSKSVLMGISFGIGYLCPTIISVITIGVTYPQNSYIRKDACWLSWREKYPILAFVIPALVIIVSNVIVLVVVIFKLLRPTIGDRPRGHNEEKDTIKLIVRSIAVLTPILGLTWAFGIPTFQEDSHDAFHYIFTILNAFQGFFILVFGTCMDKKVREALLKKNSLNRFSSQSRSERSVSTRRFTFKHGIALPGRRKKLNISGRLYSDSKDTLTSYSTLS